jgi:hypothetical protein
MKSRSKIVWDVTQCSPVKVRRRFWGAYCLYLHGRRVCQATNQPAGRLLLTGFFLSSFLDCEGEGSMFLRKLREFQSDYAPLNPRWHYSSWDINLSDITQKCRTVAMFVTVDLQTTCTQGVGRRILCLRTAYPVRSSETSASFYRLQGITSQKTFI